MLLCITTAYAVAQYFVEGTEKKKKKSIHQTKWNDFKSYRSTQQNCTLNNTAEVAKKRPNYQIKWINSMIWLHFKERPKSCVEKCSSKSKTFASAAQMQKKLRALKKKKKIQHSPSIDIFTCFMPQFILIMKTLRGLC